MMNPPEAAALARLTAAGFKGRAARLSDLDLPRLGATIGVGEDEIHSVIEVETSGGGFDKAGRPKALYEPHRAFALSSGPTRAALVRAGLAYASWGAEPYPDDSYPRILAALAIDARVALEATSWGLGQIMGSNHAEAGYASAAEMVAAFLDGEEPHLAAMVSFIKATHLDDELRAHNWAAFARGYNGAQYSKNKYDVKLKAAFAKWQKIPDTPYPPAPAAPSAAPAVAAVPGRCPTCGKALAA
ncbi:hypothetical protein OPKNFCMD_3817 [Methylobacterium crusticola]|uniref:N-acetylmuramidase domain-containing protein n=1 Tax=Methylobacterium crusticola TaxID=1697972 RepID=A0ABQ4R2K9_9HYPH|nr:N-acetylmuramidase family protein [Methylobacterium crusticola]GJD51066.1 hypothetical protein OPKNFCMD_3817 [Methylobacterium crusticola]